MINLSKIYDCDSVIFSQASYTTVREAIGSGRGASRFTVEELGQVMPSVCDP